MLKVFGGFLFILGLLLTFFAFYQTNYRNFLIEIIFGPLLMQIGFQILR